MTLRSFVATVASFGCALVLCQAAAAQSFDAFFVDARTNLRAFVQRSVATIPDEVIAAAIRRPREREQLLGSLFDTNLDPSGTPTWAQVLAWESGHLLSSSSLLALWQSKKELVSNVLKDLAPEERQTVYDQILRTQRALDDYRLDRQNIRLAFRELKDAYSLCEGRHNVNTQTLKNANYRLTRLMKELGDEPGPLAFADRLWNAGGYQLLSVALVVTGDLVATLSDSRAVLQSSLAGGPVGDTSALGMQ